MRGAKRGRSVTARPSRTPCASGPPAASLPVPARGDSGRLPEPSHGLERSPRLRLASPGRPPPGHHLRPGSQSPVVGPRAGLFGIPGGGSGEGARRLRLLVAHLPLRDRPERLLLGEGACYRVVHCRYPLKVSGLLWWGRATIPYPHINFSPRGQSGGYEAPSGTSLPLHPHPCHRRCGRPHPPRLPRGVPREAVVRRMAPCGAHTPKRLPPLTPWRGGSVCP